MKTNVVSLFALLAAASVGLAVEVVPPPCCATPKVAPAGCEVKAANGVKPAAAACCDEIQPVAPLTARSLYQLDAKWTSDAGGAYSLASQRGRPVVLAMFFSSCEYACPVLVEDIRRLRAALPEETRGKAQIVLVSFDVARDTPAVLAAFRERMNLDSAWTLLRGDPMAVQDLAMLLGVKFKQDARGQFAHSNLLTILNAEGEIVHQHAGLMGDVSEPAKVVAALAR